ncbi:MAG: GDP-mannose 4,6-dehydratase [Pseudomonadota bacterium]
MAAPSLFNCAFPEVLTFEEETPYAPNSPYAASKAGSDHLVRAYHKTYGLNVTTSNCSNNYGPFQFPEKLIPLTISNALTGKNLPVYGDGSNIRDWLYVVDHCRGIECVLNQGRIGETYNIGGANEIANINIVNEICRRIDIKFQTEPALGKRFVNCPASSNQKTESLITFVTDRPGHDWRYAICPDKTNKELGFSPHVDFTTGLDMTIQWMLDQEDWWQAILDGSYRSGSVS